MRKIPTIRSAMTPFPYSVDTEMPLRQARNVMLEHDVRHLPVVRDGKLVGVLSDRDLKRALDPSLGLPPKDELFVDDVMVHDPYVIDTHERLDRVLLRMADEHIGCALVVKDGRLAGIFTTTDACRVFGEHLQREYGPPGGGDEAA